MRLLRVITGHLLKECLGEERASKVKPERITPKEFAELADLTNIMNLLGEDPEQLGLNISEVLRIAYSGSELSAEEITRRTIMVGHGKKPEEVEFAANEEIVLVYVSRDGAFNLAKTSIPS